ncbi:hypothetical protein H5410_032596 [Solanum commersonii]|uniref:O-methyltransferase dimerisation domain-containing protein n=1 Tax=Solanum commersonii TaxID=4109 RepID=A0A9J5YLD9_SOLCO|nr:hypothetical protein H5410_032596 [Solanum commersonii]
MQCNYCHHQYFPFVLNSTIELDVFEILAKANDTQLSSSQIVSKMPCNNPIDAANMGKMFVSDNEDGASLGPLLALLQHKVFINTW